MKKQIAGKWRSNFFRPFVFLLVGGGKCWIHVGKWWEIDRGFLVDGIIMENDGNLFENDLTSTRKTPFLSQEAENSPHQGDRATITAIIGDDFHVS